MKRIITALLAMVLAAGLMTGCANSSKSDKITIRFATWDNAEDLDQLQGMVTDFNESQNEIKVVMEAYGSDFDTKIAASMGSKDAPDVMYMWNYPAYHGGLEPLDEFVAAEGEEYKANFFEALWPSNSMKGNVYGIPIGYTTHVLYYNKDIFDEVGIAYPDENWTWDDVRKASKTITEKYGDAATKGFVFPIAADPYDFEMYLWSNGTSYVDQQGQLDGYLNSESALHVYKFFQDLAKDGYGAGVENNGNTAFTSGAAAMYVNASWPIASITQAGINFGVAPLPAWQAGKPSVSVLSSSGMAMSADSKHKDAAWEFIKYWTSEQANIARIEYELPVLKSVVAQKELEQDAVKSVFYTMLAQSQGYTPTSFIVEQWSQLSDKLELAFENMFNPTSYADPAETMEKVLG